MSNWWPIAVVIIYYMAAGFAIKKAYPAECCHDQIDRIFLWTFSPLYLVIVVLIIVGWLAAYLLSFGLVYPPWRKPPKKKICNNPDHRIYS